MSESRDLNKFLVRMPEGMRDRLKEEAAKNNRSMNAEIVHRLAESLAGGAIEPQALRELRGILIKVMEDLDGMDRNETD